MIKVAIDGLSGSGKGVLADGLAKDFNLKHLDTGAIFRAIGVYFSEKGIVDPTENDIIENMEKIDVEVKFEGNVQKMFLNGKDVTSKLREELVSSLASKTSAFGQTREKYLKIVREFAENYDCVIDGRDITSIVLPNADLKIYLTANEETRAKRRYAENVEKNITCTYDEVLSNLQERDYRDTHRDVAPLIIVDDAIVVDNTNLNIAQTIEYCSKLLKDALNKK